MENQDQTPYQDSPSSSRSATPELLSPVSIKSPTYPVQPYRDEPDTPTTTIVTAPLPPLQNNGLLAPYMAGRYRQGFPVYTDEDQATHSDDDVPLAYLYPYPTDAPPAYSVAVRQSYRETLITHIPPGSGTVAIDDEEGVEHPHPDDIRFFVERVVAALIVTILLMLISGLMFWLALGYSMPK